jgi:hypothetical protein
MNRFEALQEFLDRQTLLVEATLTCDSLSPWACEITITHKEARAGEPGRRTVLVGHGPAAEEALAVALSYAQQHPSTAA